MSTQTTHETSTAKQAVRVEHDTANGVATIILDRPEGRNSFDVATLDQVRTEVRHVEDDPQIRAVILTGTGKYFCTGGDVAEMYAHREHAASHFDALTLRYHALMDDIRKSDKIWIAAINGVAAGGGIGLALTADLVVAGHSARFVTAYANLGASPDGGLSHHLVAAIGPHRAREMLLIDDGVGADTLHAWGLANRLVADDQVRPEAEAMARKVATRARITVRHVKRLVDMATHSSADDLLAEERRTMIAAAAAPDVQEGLAAFNEKRAPRFGR